MENNLFEVKGLQVGYLHKTILQNVSFALHTGEMVGIIGANGAGKSTLLKTLSGILPWNTGQIFLEKENIKELSMNSFARKVAYLPQNIRLPFDFVVKDIVLTGRYPYNKWWQNSTVEDYRIVDDCLQYMGIADLAQKNVLDLSGGQQQRVFLAKILAQQTPLMFLDEPTAGLDIYYQEELLRLCQKFCSLGKTVLLVLHELSLAARFCSRLLLVGKNTLLADGRPAQIMTDAYLSEAYGAPIKAIENPLTGHWDIYTEEAE